MTKVIQKFVKNNNQTIESVGDNLAVITKLQDENHLLESYLPKQLTDEQLHNIVESFVRGHQNPNMGVVMQHLKSFYNGRYDGKQASFIVKDILA